MAHYVEAQRYPSLLFVGFIANRSGRFIVLFAEGYFLDYLKRAGL